MTKLALRVPDDQAEVESRVRYAFSIFALAHGHEVVEPSQADHVIDYGGPDCPATPRWRQLDRPAPHPSTVDGLPCHHPLAGGAPDPLAEIFEWTSLAHESATTERDGAGRVPSTEHLAIRAGLSPTTPWGSRWIDTLQEQLRRSRGIESNAAPLGGDRALIGASHDVDFLPTSALDTARRVGVWAVVAATRFADRRGAAAIAWRGVRHLARGGFRHGLLDVAREEHRRGIQATYTWLTRDAHPRDARYRSDDPLFARRLTDLADLGHEHAVHGSYTSLDDPNRLRQEYDHLRSLGVTVAGGRQHWLRYDRSASLLHALETAGARYDATAGFSDRIGFRTGLAHPHPLYDLEHDRASEILEIPTPIMDVAIADRSTTSERWRDEVTEVMAAIDAHTLGGVSLLWHDPVLQGVQLPRRFADLYWDLHDPDRHAWVPLESIEKSTRTRLDVASALPTS